MSHGVSRIGLEIVTLPKKEYKYLKKWKKNENIQMNHFCTAKRYVSAVVIATPAYYCSLNGTAISTAWFKLD